MCNNTDATVNVLAEWALTAAGQHKPFGGMDWNQTEGWPIRAAMHRHTMIAIRNAIDDSTS